MTLYPLFHPAAALYTPAMLETLRADFAGIPALLAPPEAPPSRRPLRPEARRADCSAALPSCRA